MANAAGLKPAGDATPGVQPVGIVAQYQLDATLGNLETPGTANTAGPLGSIGPYDSGTILGTVPPGKAGLKLVEGTVQRAAVILDSADAGYVGNALVPVYSLVGAAVTDHDGLPVPPTGSQPADGLSEAPNRE